MNTKIKQMNVLKIGCAQHAQEKSKYRNVTKFYDVKQEIVDDVIQFLTIK